MKKLLRFLLLPLLLPVVIIMGLVFIIMICLGWAFEELDLLDSFKESTVYLYELTRDIILFKDIKG